MNFYSRLPEDMIYNILSYLVNIVDFHVKTRLIRQQFFPRIITIYGHDRPPRYWRYPELLDTCGPDNWIENAKINEPRIFKELNEKIKKAQLKNCHIEIKNINLSGWILPKICTKLNIGYSTFPKKSNTLRNLKILHIYNECDYFDEYYYFTDKIGYVQHNFQGNYRDGICNLPNLEELKIESCQCLHIKNLPRLKILKIKTNTLNIQIKNLPSLEYLDMKEYDYEYKMSYHSKDGNLSYFAEITNVNPNISYVNILGCKTYSLLASYRKPIYMRTDDKTKKIPALIYNMFPLNFNGKHLKYFNYEGKELKNTVYDAIIKLGGKTHIIDECNTLTYKSDTL